MSLWFFVSDLHGNLPRYGKLFQAIRIERPAAVLLGGDLLPHPFARHRNLPEEPFIPGVLQSGFTKLRSQLGSAYPQVFIIPGNDDPRFLEAELSKGEVQGLWDNIHERRVDCGAFPVYGYACVPPTPFTLKDWERYDVSRYVDPGCISPEEGWHSVPAGETHFATIQAELEKLTDQADLSRSVFLFHAPPYRTVLDRAALDGKIIGGISVDVHVGSIAIRSFIETRQPWITLHGHVHESARMTGLWRERLGCTWAFSAAHDGNELALVRFDPEVPERATRELI